MRRRWRWILGGLAALVVGAGVFFVIEEPAAGAYACPSCYGFARAENGLYLDTQMPEGERAALSDTLEEATSRVRAFYGDSPGARDVPIFVCGSAACDERMNYRGAKGVAFGQTFILLYAKGRTAEFLSHELSHIALARRIGFWKVVRDAVPAWFNEGLAVLVSRDARFVRTAEDGTQQCITEPTGPLPETAGAWGRAMGDRTRPLYAMAACKTLHWMGRNGGRAGALDLLRRIGEGGAFPEPESP